MASNEQGAYVHPNDVSEPENNPVGQKQTSYDHNDYVDSTTFDSQVHYTNGEPVVTLTHDLPKAVYVSRIGVLSKLWKYLDQIKTISAGELPLECCPCIPN